VLVNHVPLTLNFEQLGNCWELGLGPIFSRLLNAHGMQCLMFGTCNVFAYYTYSRDPTDLDE
jgi:hypothetical protein